MGKTTSEYNRFESFMQELIKVPHSEIKAKLEAEKRAKKRKKFKKSSSASREGV
jgi:hypothetical protein